MKYFLGKFVVLLVVFALVQIPLHWTESINNERMSFKQEAVASVAGSYAGHQYLAGPVLVFPYTYTYWEVLRNKDGNLIGREPRTRTGSVSVLPKQLSFDNDVVVEERRVGIFPVPVFQAAIRIGAEFSWDALSTPVTLHADDALVWGHAYLALPIADQHGIKRIETVAWNGTAVGYAPGSHIELFGAQGIHAAVDAGPATGNGKADIRLHLIGTELLHNLPTAEQTRVNFKSNWPHPQFIGGQLPDQREVTDTGFVASWQSTALATNINASWEACLATGQCDALKQESVGVQMIDPTNFYATMSRALKYGFLFLAITFMSFVLFEVLCDLRIHPVQYTLLGIASGIFFLLLLSLAEHIGFATAYGIAAGACLLVLSVYAHALLKQRRRTMGFSAVLATLYAVLFIILRQEDAALVTGSILLFVLLSITMMITRNIDWYAWQDKYSKPQIADAS